jgi:hypothetical protein
MPIGGWKYEDMPGCALPQKAATAFDKAVSHIIGITYKPVLFVATQLVSGTNYCIICKTTLVTNPPMEGCKIVFIYEDLEGNCSLTKIQDVI